ncbi:ABC transporter substrate-binding protein [Modestobacter sp. VKM Ac-2985]|uniref:ABC transporter substrate-binding protein n=1 Tax=Modestobacter sp. VKM Ac-2985 TaxID=3004139 RepID=UPI0022ABBDD5|nr:ABC transporter substrate-binding protein [Modestobacter sp. VKM Ac-2985]MCZ2839394.1 ABC transporter substrate-binding protein [Modestobacter sp. VKM Ac-2985]
MKLFRTRDPLVVPRPSLTRTGVAVLAAGALTSLAACGGGEGGGGTSSQSPSDTLAIGLDSDPAPTGYDPLLYSDRQFEFFAPLYDALFVTASDGSIEPSLVAESTNNEENTQTTLILRDGVTFDDGSALTAELVKANLDRRSDPDLEAYGALAEGQAAAITDVTVQDEQTVVITWAQPQATPAANLDGTTGIIVGPTGIADPASLETDPDGSGAYELDEAATTRASTYTLEKNAEHWNADAWAYDGLDYRIITDPQALANALVSGQVDIAGQLKDNAINLVESQQSIVSQGGTIVGFPVTDKLGQTNPAFGEEAARLALLHAIDRESLVNDLHPGARPTVQLFPEESAGFDPALDEEFGYDPERARELLAEAGYPDGFELDITRLGQPEEDLVAIQQQLAEVGITLNFVAATSTDQVFAAVRTDPVLWGPFAVGANPEGFIAGVVYGGFMNMQGAQEPEIDQALGAALGSTGEAQDQARQELNRALVENGWFFPVYEDFTYYGYNADKVAEPPFAGANNYLVLSDVEPAV